MQFIVATVDERDFIVVVKEEDDENAIRALIAECFFYDDNEINLGKRSVACGQIIHSLGLMHFDVLEIKDESELVEDTR